MRVFCSFEARAGAENCPRPPSMAGTPVPPCTSLCPSAGWGYSGPGRYLCGPQPGCCPQLSSGRATVHCAAPAGLSTCQGRPRRSPSALWFCLQQPAPRRQSCFLARHHSAERQKCPVPRSCPRSFPWATQLRSTRTGAPQQT